MEINELVKAVHKTAVSKGWWEKDRNPLEIYSLIHSEISEAVEEARLGVGSVYYKAPDGLAVSIYDGVGKHNKPAELFKIGYKPEGELIELADAVIRIADYCGRMGWNLEDAIKLKMSYNETRPHRHGGKKY